MKKTRTYRLKERAKSQEDTRRKIVEAAMRLHESVGPRATTISAIAEKAGVQRLTVYRHFQDETAIFQACTAHWLSLHPPPDPAAWADIEDAGERVRAALGAFYRYYSGTREMWTASFRDVAHVPALQGPMREFTGFVDAVGNDLAAAMAKGGDPDSRLTVSLGHALTFGTWADLDARGLDDDAKVALALAWIDGVR